MSDVGGLRVVTLDSLVPGETAGALDAGQLRRLGDLLATPAERGTVLTGHLHFQAGGFLAGVPVWVTPGVVTRVDTTAVPHLVRGVLGAAATVVDLAGLSAPTFHLLQARDPRAGVEVYVFDAVTGEDVPEP